MSLQLLDELSQRERSLCVCFHVGRIFKPSPHSSEGMDWTEVRSAEKLVCTHLFLKQAKGRGLSIPALRIPGSDCCREGHLVCCETSLSLTAVCSALGPLLGEVILNYF